MSRGEPSHAGQERASDAEYGLREACGVFGCVATDSWPTDLDVAHIVHLGLIGLQHRGQESAGIVTSTGDNRQRFSSKKYMGLVNSFTEEDLKKLRGNLGIGHTRYSTQGDSDLVNVQPFVVETLHGLIAVAHNGELVNAAKLKTKLLLHGVGLSTGSDSELVTQLLTHQPDCGEPNGANWIGRIQKMMSEAPLSYSLLILIVDRIYAIRDPFGNRPLVLGKVLPTTIPLSGGKSLKNGGDNDGWVVSSESCSLHAVGAVYYREVLPGEIVEISREGIKSKCIVPRPEAKLPAFCIFEYVYFARPDSIMEGQMVHSVRQRCGRRLALECPVDVDLVSCVPESACPAAMEYASTLGLPYREVLCKNRYVGRTFIQPSMRLRQLGVAKKFGPLTDNFRNKRIVLVDDSIVRGNTMAAIVRLLKNFGAKEVHIRVASPPLRYPCYMGINIPTREELIANNMSIAEIAEFIGAESVAYLSIEGLVEAVQEGIEKKEEHGHCTACLSGQYPVNPDW
ncbi:hypothetical protein C0Q70_05775 [Pomacea canaliculata]|uniref:Amidophosphoribosyltransferase n=1 Tax=Pomacea canaliculata TaxID=400727 RepID=A0A2T7PM49_POMCA|nr:amidophosphoribosyltransferase-like [Pomacea canaliculata]XP_025088840.1 amidophosphoribosyltransferase-like [Pomacea canaliculata]XP_025088841.1 amidophosphoribosyltransferase-like [Pomacea canaliculata]XP_025088842.1 amidophosphoribosyltransferase-like [Pomacea canaliculata]PVD34500.1 hypothetical protein C0Q70_05775 [Pomacea canaliculata]